LSFLLFNIGWILAAFYSALALAINLLGVKDFGRIESLFGVIKTSSLVIFIILGLFFIINGTIVHTAIIPPASPGQWFPHGLTGLWSAMIFVLFSYGGIEVMGILSQELKNTREIGPAGRLMLIALTSIYSLALLMVVLMVPWQSVNTSASPFITALLPLRLGFIDSLLNAIIISAAFSTMVGALFAVTNILVSLAEDEDAPLVLARRTPRGVPVPAMSLTATGLLIAIIMSFLLPATVYEYLATAAGVMLILNWIIILGAQIKNRPAYMRSSGFVRYSMRGYPLTSYLAIGIIVLTISGALLHPAQRIGVLVSLVLAAAIYFISRLPQIHGKAGLQASPARKKFPDAGER
jgi:L-asparagine transporter-like permease